jgi:hypothetical protein
VTSGRVVVSTDVGGVAGKYIRIDVGGGVWVGYSHLSRRDVAVGQFVSTGQIIGLAGATGGVTAAHLHFEVCVNGVKVDPVPYLAARTGVDFAGNPIGGSGGGSLPTAPTSPDIAPPALATKEPTMKVIQGFGQAAIWSTDSVWKLHLTTQSMVNDMLKICDQTAPIVVGGETINALRTYVAPPTAEVIAGEVWTRPIGQVDGVNLTVGQGVQKAALAAVVTDDIKTDTNVLKAGVATLIERPQD